MWYNSLGEVEHRVHVDRERVLPLLRVERKDIVVLELLRGVVEQDVDAPEDGERLVDGFAAVGLGLDVEGNEVHFALAAGLLLDLGAGVFRVFLFRREVDDGTRSAINERPAFMSGDDVPICTFERSKNDKRATDTRVAARGERDLPLEFARRFIRRTVDIDIVQNLSWTKVRYAIAIYKKNALCILC